MEIETNVNFVILVTDYTVDDRLGTIPNLLKVLGCTPDLLRSER